MQIYLAGPLFTHAEQQWLAAVRDRLSDLPYCRVVWPYDLVRDADMQRWGAAAKQHIYQLCRSHLDRTDLLIALLDGTQVDDGTAWEIGYFTARRRAGQHLVGLRTDFRRAGDAPGAVVNLMIDCACDRIVDTADRLLEECRRLVSAAVPS